VEEKARKLAQGITLRETIADYCMTGAKRMAPAHAHKADIASRQRSLPIGSTSPSPHQPRGLLQTVCAPLEDRAFTREPRLIILRALLNFARNRYRRTTRR